MRLVPNTDTVPASVNRYLLPNERQVITVHQHPAILIKPIFWVLIGLALAGWLSNSIANGNGIVADYKVARFFTDCEALYSYEGTYQMQNLIVGKAITGHGAFI